MLRRVGGVQLDTISVLARSHELVAYARLGAIPRDRIERAYWNPAQPSAFEYWAHAACVLPIEEWPYCTPSGGAGSGPAVCAGTRCHPRYASRSWPRCGPRGR